MFSKTENKNNVFAATEPTSNLSQNPSDCFFYLTRGEHTRSLCNIVAIRNGTKRTVFSDCVSYKWLCLEGTFFKYLKRSLLQFVPCFHI